MELGKSRFLFSLLVNWEFLQNLSRSRLCDLGGWMLDKCWCQQPIHHQIWEIGFTFFNKTGYSFRSPGVSCIAELLFQNDRTTWKHRVLNHTSSESCAPPAYLSSVESDLRLKCCIFFENSTKKHLKVHLKAHEAVFFSCFFTRFSNCFPSNLSNPVAGSGLSNPTRIFWPNLKCHQLATATAWRNCG